MVLELADMHEGLIESQRDGTGAGLMWTQQLNSTGILGSLGDREVLYCPTVDSNFPGQDPAAHPYADGPWHWRTYGMFMIPNFPEEGAGILTTRGGGFGQQGVNVYRLTTASVSAPSQAPLLADSKRTSDDAQIFRIRSRGVANGEGIRLAHGDTATIFFLDGHVERANIQRLAQLGFTSAYRHDSSDIVNFPAPN